MAAVICRNMSETNVCKNILIACKVVVQYTVHTVLLIYKDNIKVVRMGIDSGREFS